MKNYPLLYTFHELAYQASGPLLDAARIAQTVWSSPLNPMADTQLGRTLYAAADLTDRLARRYGRPAWGIESVEVRGAAVPVVKTTVWSSPWCDLVRFVAPSDAPRPKVLLVAPLSGHYATLLRGTVRTFVADHDVYVTDWANARDVSICAGDFDFHDYIDHVRTMLTQLGERAHVVAVCQPGPCVLAAAALMAEDGDPCRPATMTFMGSPIDARLAPTITNRLAEARPFSWFHQNMIQTVPLPHVGAGRQVYPGFVQLMSFMLHNRDRHEDAHWRYFRDLVAGDGEATDKHREFYDEYLSVLDLTASFYLQTVDLVFQRYSLPKGELVHRGRLVRPEAIVDIGLCTVEGADDDISGVGQTQAAHTLCSAIPDSARLLYVQPDVGHFGVFNGRRFVSEIYPRVARFISAHAPRAPNPSSQGR